MKVPAILAGAAMVAIAAMSARAATIGAGPSPSLNVTTAPGNLGYWFGTVGAAGGGGFVTSPPPNTIASLPSWATLATDTGYSYSGGTYATLTAGGTTFQTGFTWTSGATAAAPNTLATVTLGTGVPSSFTLGFLVDNTNQTIDDTAMIVSSGTTSQTVNNPPGGATPVDNENDFYFVSVTGANPGDTITIQGFDQGGTGSGANAGLSGITFGTAAAPEPVSLGLLGTAGLLMGRRRRN